MPKNIDKNNGGYYAIKGFVYQFDKTILDILNNPTTKIFFETEQDINFDDSVIQVKYKETQKFSDSKIKKPIIQLLKEYISIPDKKYFLYCYFNNVKEEDKENIGLTRLDNILGNQKNDYTKKIKNNFLSKFTLSFSPNFDEHFEDVVNKIKVSFNCKSVDEAIIYHGRILDHLLRKITTNSYIETKARNSSKAELKKIRFITEKVHQLI